MFYPVYACLYLSLLITFCSWFCGLLHFTGKYKGSISVHCECWNIILSGQNCRRSGVGLHSANLDSDVWLCLKTSPKLSLCRCELGRYLTCYKGSGMVPIKNRKRPLIFPKQLHELWSAAVVTWNCLFLGCPSSFGIHSLQWQPSSKNLSETLIPVYLSLFY